MLLHFGKLGCIGGGGENAHVVELGEKEGFVLEAEWGGGRQGGESVGQLF